LGKQKNQQQIKYLGYPVSLDQMLSYDDSCVSTVSPDDFPGAPRTADLCGSGTQGGDGTLTTGFSPLLDFFKVKILHFDFKHVKHGSSHQSGGGQVQMNDEYQ
jgi:hypothetical protein